MQRRAPTVNEGYEPLWRDERNPILTVADLSHPASAVFNPAAVQQGDETLLLLRIENRDGISHLGTARSADGVTGWTIEEPPALAPQPDRFPEEVHGIEDPRITRLDELGRYAVAYTAYSDGGPLVALATTRDFVEFDRMGAVLPPENKDAALFPVRFDGRWAILHRPVSTFAATRAHIWIAFSDDLRRWGEHRAVLKVQPSPHWDAERIGLGPPPLLTDEGWLVLYHAVHRKAGDICYYLGLALLDRDDPTRVIARCNDWIFGPDADYERTGRGGVVFPCGWIRDGDDLRIYYGAGDRSVGLAHARVSGLLEWLRRYECAEP